MKHYVQFFLALTAVPALSACAQNPAATAPIAQKISTTTPALQTKTVAHAQMASLPIPPSPAFAADDFIDSIGINGSPIQTNVYTDGPFKGAGKSFAPQLYYDLGIRYYRIVLKYGLTRDDQPQQVLDAWKKSGAKAMMFLSHNEMPPQKPGGTKSPLDALPLLRKYDLRAVEEIEGPNEPNNKFPPQDLNQKYGGKTDEAATAQYMQEFYDALKADAQLNKLPVVSYSAIFTDYNLAKGHTGFDLGNIHSYQGYGVPSSSLESNITRFNNILPSGAVIRPFVPTETGYNVDADVSNGTFKTGSFRAQSLNIPMLLAEYFRHGIQRTYLFAIHNADGYGLLESDNVTKRPSYFAVKNFLAQIREAKWNSQTLKWEGAKPFKPRSLNFTLEGAPATVHTLTLQKSTGEYSLLIWNEVPNLDEGAKKDIVNAPVPVKIRFGAPVGTSATILTQNAKGAYDSKTVAMTDRVLEVAVPSSVCIIKIKAGALPKIAAPPAVTGLDGKATWHQADLKWTSVAGAAGYFVFRNGWQIGTVKNTSFSERTSWLRPSLGYIYEVQAFDKYGQMAPRAKKILFTPNGRPDLVVTRVWSKNARVGQPANFSATLKNIGDGPTPLDTTLGVTFYVNGGYTNYGGGNRVLDPGQEVTVSGDGGNANWAPDKAGSYVVTAQADDINRVSGEVSESNNKTDWTMPVGQTGSGQLLLSTEQAPGSVDLEKDGTMDWIAFGTTNAEAAKAKTELKRKVGANKIGALTEFGQGYLSSTAGSPVRLNWTGGGANSGLWWNGVGHGVKFSVPATAQLQTLKLYVSGLSGARGKLEVSLSDNSAPSLASTLFDGNRGNGNWAPVPDNFSGVYVVSFKAAGANQTLNVSWSMDGEPNAWTGQIRLQAITLSQK